MNAPKEGNSYVSIYFYRCNEEGKSHDEIDTKVYTRLAELDSKLGTKASKSLYNILADKTMRTEFIKVLIFTFIEGFKIILEYRL